MKNKKQVKKKNKTWFNYVVVAAVLLIPFMYNAMWQDTLGEGKGKTFFKWYFSKSKRVNLLGYIVFLVIGSGSFIYYIFLLLANILIYIIVLPICWIFEFLFLNKDCSDINLNKLNKKEIK